MALLSMVPFARSALPELSQMSKTGIGIFVVLVLGAFAIVKTIQIPPDTVPDGLLSIEYEHLGTKFIEEEKYNLAARAFDKALADASNKQKNSIARTRACRLPKTPQPDEAIKMNLDALKLSQDKDSDAALQKWNECMAKYPDFEQPAVHVAEQLLKKSRDPKAAEQVLNSVLAKNPIYFDALNEMASVKVKEHDSTASMQYTMKAFKAAAGEDDESSKMMEGALTNMQANIEKAEKELKARKAKQRSGPGQQSDAAK